MLYNQINSRVKQVIVFPFFLVFYVVPTLVGGALIEGEMGDRTSIPKQGAAVIQTSHIPCQTMYGTIAWVFTITD